MTTPPPFELPPTGLLIALAISATVIALIHHVFARRGATQSLLKIGTDESGAAYSLPLVLTVPLYALMLSTVVEVTLVLGCRIGVQYAAYAAARAATVWVPAEIPEEKRMGMIHLAAVNAMTPYASGHAQHVTSHRSRLTASAATADDLIEAYQTYSSGDAPEDYLRRKWQYAAAATEIVLEIESDEYDSPATVVVTYEFPMNVPLVGRFLGHAAPWGARHNTYQLTARATLGLERPKSKEQTLGITYGRDLGFESTATVLGNLDAPKDSRFDGGTSDGGATGSWGEEPTSSPSDNRDKTTASTDGKSILDRIIKGSKDKLNEVIEEVSESAKTVLDATGLTGTHQESVDARKRIGQGTLALGKLAKDISIVVVGNKLQWNFLPEDSRPDFYNDARGNVSNVFTAIWDDFKQGYKEAYEEGGLPQASGRAVVDIFKIIFEVIATKGAGAAIKGAGTATKVVDVADDLGDAAKVANRIENKINGGKKGSKIADDVPIFTTGIEAVRQLNRYDTGRELRRMMPRHADESLGAYNKRIDSHLEAIDWNHPVELVEVPAGTRVGKYVHANSVDGKATMSGTQRLGSYTNDRYFADPTHNGIGDWEFRSHSVVEVNKDTLAIRSTAADIKTTRPDSPAGGQGGNIQLTFSENDLTSLGLGPH